MDETSRGEQAQLRTGRLDAFSDGVFAIAITLLVLEISVPTDVDHGLLRAVLDEWPSYLAYVVSFSTIGALWLGHTAVTEHLDHANTWLLRLNLLVLFLVAFLPFPTRLFAESLGERDAARVATIIYGLTLLCASALLSALWRYAVHGGLIRPDTTNEEVVFLTRKLTPGLGGYAALIALGFFVPVVAAFGYLAIAIYFLVPFRLLRRRR